MNTNAKVVTALLLTALCSSPVFALGEHHPDNIRLRLRLERLEGLYAEILRAETPVLKAELKAEIETEVVAFAADRAALYPWGLVTTPSLPTIVRYSARFAQLYLSYLQSAVKGDTRAQLELQVVLGLTYPDGRVIPQDEEEAAQWFQAKAEQGLTGAQYILGLMYLGGVGVTRDYEEAYGWLATGADQGHRGATAEMALAMRNALSTDRYAGYSWVTFATVLPALKESMTPSGLERAEELEREYREKYAPE